MMWKSIRPRHLPEQVEGAPQKDTEVALSRTHATPSNRHKPVFIDLQADNPQAGPSFSAPSLNCHTDETANDSYRLLVDGSSEPKIPLLVDITANLCRDLIGKTGSDAGSAPLVGSQFQSLESLSPVPVMTAISPISPIAGKAKRMQKENPECTRSDRPKEDEASFLYQKMTPKSNFLSPGQSQSLSDQNLLLGNVVSVSPIPNSSNFSAIASESSSHVVISLQSKSKRGRGKGGTDPPRTRQ
eukprot:TRINITY_DN9447_c0_g4_i1.p1 TRINITY_DN9447_c0_g4~~TRINITY_DN9447_c0_g4_i1.p1  ORF type:complete len:243 (-),score=32.09 TRINITY_DN9447_c0_g4_i1:54-782(-)